MKVNSRAPLFLNTRNARKGTKSSSKVTKKVILKSLAKELVANFPSMSAYW